MLIDGGANGGYSGDDVTLIEESQRRVSISGLDSHTVKNIPVSTVAGVLTSTSGPIIAIFHQYAHKGSGITVHSVNQLKAFGIQVHDSPTIFGSRSPCLMCRGIVYPSGVIRQGGPLEPKVVGESWTWMPKDLSWLTECTVMPEPLWAYW